MRADWLHRYAVFTAVATFGLIIAGGLVTSTGSGLAVPDWPLSFGQVFPKMEGGVLFEHGHRLVAATVGLLTVILALWLFRSEPRRWVRRLGGLAVLTVLIQGGLGGLTVLLKLPPAVSISHAGLAQVFFCLVVCLAQVTAPAWRRPAAAPARPGEHGGDLRRLAQVTTVLVYGQILLGAITRHLGAGLAIPDFPTSFGRWIPPMFSVPIAVNYAHRVGALIVTVFVIGLANRICHAYVDRPVLLQPALALLGLVLVQVGLGAFTVWTGKPVGVTTAHVATGALLLVASLVLTLRLHRFLGPVSAAGAAPAAKPAPA